MDKMKEMIEDTIDKVKTSSEPVPIVLVGGGNILVDDKAGLKGGSAVHTPQYSDVANAIGAALSQVSGSVEYVVSLEDFIDKAAFNAESDKVKDVVEAENSETKLTSIRKRYLEVAHAKAMKDACDKAKQVAVESGATESSVIVVEQSDTPLSYLPGNATKNQGQIRW